MDISDFHIYRRYQLFGEVIRYTGQGRRIYRLMFNQIGVDIDSVKTYVEHKENEAKYTALIQRQLSEVDPDNDESELTITRGGTLEFTSLGWLFYGVLFGRAIIDIRTIKTRIQFESALDAAQEMIIDCWIDFSKKHPGKSLFIDKMAAIALGDDQKMDDLEEKILLRDSVSLC